VLSKTYRTKRVFLLRFLLHVTLKLIAYFLSFHSYHGFGKIANIYHSQPRFTPAHAIVFNNEEVGVIFLQLNDFMIFKRINRDFPVKPNLARRSKVFNGNS